MILGVGGVMRRFWRQRDLRCYNLALIRSKPASQPTLTIWIPTPTCHNDVIMVVYSSWPISRSDTVLSHHARNFLRIYIFLLLFFLFIPALFECSNLIDQEVLVHSPPAVLISLAPRSQELERCALHVNLSLIINGWKICRCEVYSKESPVSARGLPVCL